MEDDLQIATKAGITAWDFSGIFLHLPTRGRLSDLEGPTYVDMWSYGLLEGIFFLRGTRKHDKSSENSYKKYVVKI